MQRDYNSAEEGDAVKLLCSGMICGGITAQWKEMRRDYSDEEDAAEPLFLSTTRLYTAHVEPPSPN